ncbi:uncharacterized protein LOC127858717 isoform X2 [Dreissena polymorpha]|uniref:DUF4773 domain-containing protein n=1 Tax=Dreissena polymorpha TaxID=45954 RepID=A0A9D4BSH4_DREPO|nr:uncharacterized protein LOC127858717 isoform X2 [Dreissena polymorpha]KAH3706457.1 hypothetical protein DPMN_065843 [Dreissena polymorpha]
MELMVVILSVLILNVAFTGCQGKTILTNDNVVDKDNENAVVELLQLLTSIEDVQTPDIGIHDDLEAVSIDVTDVQTSDASIYDDHEAVSEEVTDAILKEIMAVITGDEELDLIKGCTHGRCKFCTRTKWFKVCVEASILRLGFEVAVTLNGRTIYRKKISIRNPPPICFNRIPGLSSLADVCLVVYDVDLGSKSACVKITFKVKIGPFKKGFSIKIGCFRIPLASSPEMNQSSGNTSEALTYNGSRLRNPYV